MSPRFFFSAAFLFLASACSHSSHLEKTETKTYKLASASNNEIDSVVYKEILPYQKPMLAEMSSVLGVSEVAMEKGTPESLLGNFFSDALLETANHYYSNEDNHPIDFAFFNTGGLRAALPKGNITKGNVFELMPFENELVVLNMNGAVAKKVFDYIASRGGAPVSGVRFSIKDKAATSIMIHNVPLDTTKTYKALTSDYLANGGDQLTFLAGVNRESLNMKIRDALIQHIQAKAKREEKISAQLDQRISNGK